jgi:hypothetical protein
MNAPGDDPSAAVRQGDAVLDRVLEREQEARRLRNIVFV